MSHPVLHEDWSEYDNRHIRGPRDSSKFSCKESWEVDYLAKKLQKHYPHKTEATIRQAISTCCSIVGAPHPREAFVECVTKRLD